MANNNRQNRLVRFFPDWPIFRRLASRTKIKSVTKNSLPEDLVGRGEAGDLKAAVDACREKFPGAFERLNVEIDSLFQNMPAYRGCDPDHLENVRRDMQFCHFAYGFTPGEYFAFRLEQKPAEQRREFISSRLRMVYRCRMNDILQADRYNDKAKTYALFKPYYRREAVVIETPKDYPAFEAFVDAHPVFVKKAVFEAQGNSVELVDIGKWNDRRQLFDKLIAVGKHILEERIVQSPQMAVFNESSVNTVRAITFNTRNGIVVPYCIVRTGAPGAFVDNAGAGGVEARIDFDTGEIVTDGYDEMGGVFANHPASRTPMKGHRLPDWDQLKALVNELPRKTPMIKFIGWDLAHTRNGWVVVEGNENCFIVAQQMIQDRGMRSVFEDIMKDMDLII